MSEISAEKALAWYVHQGAGNLITVPLFLLFCAAGVLWGVQIVIACVIVGLQDLLYLLAFPLFTVHLSGLCAAVLSIPLVWSQGWPRFARFFACLAIVVGCLAVGFVWNMLLFYFTQWVTR